MAQAAWGERRRPEPGWLLRAYQNHRATIRVVYTVILVFLVWELIGRYLVTSKLLFAPFSAVISAFATLWAKGELQRHMLVSFAELGAGFAIAAVVGVGIGSLIALSRTIAEHIDPLVNALYSTPLVALSPILILALGIEMASKIAVVFLLAVFPILVNTTAGIRATDEGLIEAARSFGASTPQIFRLVMLPAALPFIVAGLRLGIGRGIVGIFVGELFGAREGIGYLIAISVQVFDIPALFVGVLVLAIAGMVLVGLLEALERRIAPWQRFELKA